MTLPRFSLPIRLAALQVAAGILALFECAIVASIAHVTGRSVPSIVYGIVVAGNIATAFHIAAGMLRRQFD